MPSRHSSLPPGMSSVANGEALRSEASQWELGNQATLPLGTEGSPALLKVQPPAPNETLSSGIDSGATWVQRPTEVTTFDEAFVAPHASAPLEVTGEHVGRYLDHYPNGTLCTELGRGGIGRVFIAFDSHLGREVAVKELLQAPSTSEGSLGTTPRSEALGRFLREARITAQLIHPNIVPVYELGVRPSGALYYTMRVVRGRTLASAIDLARTLEKRLALVGHFAGLCHALAYAHSRGVVHRDIKPENVMIGEFGETVVLDWGLAKTQGTPNSGNDERACAISVSADLPVDATVVGSLCGTPVYMSPEQARSEIEAIDQRSDVWSLGAVLYTILAGVPPFEGKTLGEILERVRAGQVRPLRQRELALPPELCAIAERALTLDRAQRYQSAQELVADVEAYRSGARVGVYQYSFVELLRRFVARYRLAVGISLAAGIALLSLALVSYRGVVVARDRAVVAEGQALESEQRAKLALADALVDKAESALTGGDPVSAELLAARAIGIAERPDARGILMTVANLPLPAPLRDVAGQAGCSVYAHSFAARRLVCMGGERLLFFDTRSGQLLRTVEPALGLLRTLTLTADGERLAVASDGGQLAVFDGSGSLIWAGPHAAISALLLVGNTLLVGRNDGMIEELDARTGAPVAVLRSPQPITALAASTDGHTFASGGKLGRVAVWNDVTRAPQMVTEHSGTVLSLALSSSGRYLASGGSDRTVRLHDLVAGHPLGIPLRTEEAVTAVAWSGDLREIAYGGADGALFRVDMQRASRIERLLGPTGTVGNAEFSPATGEFAATGEGSGLRLWKVDSKPLSPRLFDRGNVLALSFGSRDSQLFSAGLGPSGVAFWQLPQGSCDTRLPVGAERVRSLAVGSGGKILAVADSAGHIGLWELSSRLPLRVLQGSSDEVRAVRFSPNGRTLATGGLDGHLRVWEVDSGRQLAEATAPAPVHALAYSPDGSEIASAGRDGAVVFWKSQTLRERARIAAHQGWALDVLYSSDGKTVFSAGADQLIQVLDPQVSRAVQTLKGHSGRVTCLALAPDGKLLASGGEDHHVLLWELSTGTLRALLREHTAAVRTLTFSPSGKLLASGSDDGMVRLWQRATLTWAGEAVQKQVSERFRITLQGTRVVPSAGPP